jgi:hypothetical protein
VRKGEEVLTPEGREAAKERERKRSRARSAALVRVKDNNLEEFEQFYIEEMEKRGVTYWKKKQRGS